MSNNHTIIQLLDKHFRSTVNSFDSEDILSSRFEKIGEDIDKEFYAKYLSSLFQDITTSGYTSLDMSRLLIVYFIIFSLKENNEGINIDEVASVLSSPTATSKEIENAIESGLKKLQTTNFNINSFYPFDNYKHYAGYKFNNKNFKDIYELFNFVEDGNIIDFYANSKFKSLLNKNKSFIHLPVEFLLLTEEDIKDKTSIEDVAASLSGNVNKELISSKMSPSMSVTLINDPNVRGATQNNLQFQVFMNSISTIEFSRCIPYINMRMILPELISSTNNSKKVKSASISQFLFGNRDNVLSIDTKGDAIETNMSLYTMPQTLINLNDKIGHKENNANVLKITTVHDPVRPFITLKSLDLNVTTAGGLMSYKAGHLSLVLHDKTRMTDIAPFIKPDLLGMHGAEIEIEYGWSHPDGYDKNSKNVIGKFLNLSRTKEKYQISNSTFSIDNAGIVNIKLNVTMHGPSKLNQLKFDSEVDISKNYTEIETIIKEHRKVISKHIFATERGSTAVLSSSSSNNYIDLVKNKKISIEQIQKDITILEASPKYFDPAADANSLPQASPTTPQGVLESIWDQTTKQYNWFNWGPAEKFQIDGGVVSNDAASVINRFYNFDVEKEIYTKDVSDDVIKNAIAALKKIKAMLEETKKLVSAETKKLFSRIAPANDIVDPYNLTDFAKLLLTNDQTTEGFQKKYISFGAIFSGIILQYMLPTNQYDDIQIISYTANANAGRMRHRNLFNFLIDKAEFNKFLEYYATEKIEISMTAFITRIVTEFINDDKNVSYGISDIEEKRNNTTKENVNASNSFDYKQELDNRLRSIYELEKNDKVVFKKISLSIVWDTITNKKGDKTILKISVYDLLDNPFESITNLMNSLHENPAEPYMREFNVKKRNKQNNTQHGYNALKKRYIESLEEKEILIKTSGKYSLSKEKTLSSLKAELKKMFPSVTYGTERTALKTASVSSINDHQMQAIYMTRNAQKINKKINDKIHADLPIKILPTTVSASIFGCPWVNFNQYFFFDFETGTTLDNIYVVTGIAHSIKPGSFSTELTCQPGDAFGKYENTINTLNEILTYDPDSPEPEPEPVIEPEPEPES